MAFDGKIGTIQTKGAAVLAAGHDPVIFTGAVEPNQGVWEPGTILIRAQDGLTPWDGTGEPVGVLYERCDSDNQASAIFLVHGTVAEKALKKKDGSAPTRDELFALGEIGIWGI